MNFCNRKDFCTRDQPYLWILTDPRYPYRYRFFTINISNTGTGTYATPTLSFASLTPQQYAVMNIFFLT
jgi:hypothetical protein